MKNSIVLSASLISFCSLCFIKSFGYNNSIKLYNTLNYSEKRTTTFLQNPMYINSKQENLQILHPSIAFQWQKKGSIHKQEIELSNFSINRQHLQSYLFDSLGSISQKVEDGVLVNTGIGLRYEYIFVLGRKKPRKLTPSIGLAINPYYERSAYRRPMLPQSFAGIESDIGFRTFITPRLCFQLSTKVYLDVNIPLCLTSFSVQIQKLNNPSWPNGYTNSDYISFLAGPKYFSARLGIGMKI